MRKFDLTKLGKMKSIVVESNDGALVELPYTTLKLVVVNGQLCFSYTHPQKGDLVMPIARENTINKLFGADDSEA